jgi:hypothetical protein
MAGEEQTTSNGRVTTREFYEAQLATIKLIHEVKDDLMDELKPLAILCNQVENNTRNVSINTEDIKAQNKRSNRWDSINSVLVLVGTALGISVKAP